VAHSGVLIVDANQKQAPQSDEMNGKVGLFKIACLFTDRAQTMAKNKKG
jgi:hypothetical protein